MCGRANAWRLGLAKILPLGRAPKGGAVRVLACSLSLPVGCVWEMEKGKDLRQSKRIKNTRFRTRQGRRGGAKGEAQKRPEGLDVRETAPRTKQGKGKQHDPVRVPCSSSLQCSVPGPVKGLKRGLPSFSLLLCPQAGQQSRAASAVVFYFFSFL